MESYILSKKIVAADKLVYFLYIFFHYNDIYQILWILEKYVGKPNSNTIILYHIASIWMITD